MTPITVKGVLLMKMVSPIGVAVAEQLLLELVAEEGHAPLLLLVVER